MNLIDAVVRNPVKVSVGVLMVALFGGISAMSMPMQLTPEVQIPTITIETRWPGASPQEVEQEIVQEQEEQLKSVEGVTKLSSESMDSVGRITLEFAVGANMEETLLKVNSRLQQVPSYPENADQPVISTANSSNTPIGWFILSPRYPTDDEFAKFRSEHPELDEPMDLVQKSHNIGLAMFRLRELAKTHPEVAVLLPPDVDVTKLRKFAEDYIEAAFERVDGVSNSNVIGGLEEQLEVIVDPEQLAARQLTIEDVRLVLRGQNRDTSGGDFWEGKRRWVVRTLGQFRTKEQVERQLLAIREGKPVYIADVAQVRDGFKKPDGLVRRFGESCIAVNCLRETGANVLDVMAGLRKANDTLNADILRPRGLQLVQVYDETEYIYSAVGLVNENIYLGGALTMVVLMLFLHLNRRTLLFSPFILFTGWAAVYWSPWWFAVCLGLILVAGLWYARGALIVALPIPVSIVGTFMILALLGRSLNVISLAGLAFAVGMLVDNGVVVLENIYTRYQNGEPPFVAAVNGAKEVWGAIVTSSLTNLAVFLPVLFVQEEAGQLFRDIAIAISGAVGLSMLVAICVVPPAAARLLRSHPELATEPVAQTGRLSFPQRLIGFVDRAAGYFVAFVDGVNRMILGGPMRQGLLTLAFVVGSVILSIIFWPAVEYLPNGNRNLVLGILLPPPGYNLDELADMGQFVEDELRPYWDVDPGSEAAQKLDAPIIGDFFFVARGRQVFLGVKAHDPLKAAGLVNVVRGIGSKLPGTFAVAFQTSLFGQGLQSGRTIDIEITGPELEKLVQFGGRILGGDPPTMPNPLLKPISMLIPDAQARPVPSLDLSNPEVHVTPKLWQSSEMDLSASQLGYAVDALVDGAYASDYIVGGKKIDLTIRGRDDFAQQTQDIGALPVAMPSGELVPLAAVANVTLSSGPEQINHRERERAITIQVSPPVTMPLEEAMTIIRRDVMQPLLDSGQLQGGYRLTLAGTADKLRQTWSAMWFNFALALLITYLLMAALYESWIYPFVIILSVPLGAVGGLLGLKLLGWYLIYRGEAPQALDVLTMLGFVILIGTVVNNPILIIDLSLQTMREQGLSPAVAVREAVQSRIRPIFMTAGTTMLGLLPLVLFPGAGSELYRGLGAVLLGGLTLSTVLTLFLVPASFTLTLSVERAVKDFFRGQPNRDSTAPPSQRLDKETVAVG
ncbi:MAG: efflux RND transporter permease subunit [Planctomycetaceae bacterium]|nr:efflux RND transporter permease subunit [Planctomycetaceae bacterium]